MIVKLTSPPATVQLRNCLSSIIEQAETEEHFTEVIARLRKENQDTIFRITKEYSEGKGLLIPPSVLRDIENQQQKNDT
jgi:hypothetical protein